MYMLDGKIYVYDLVSMKEYEAKVFSQEKYSLGESPFYDHRTKTLSWVDISEGKFYTADND